MFDFSSWFSSVKLIWNPMRKRKLNVTAYKATQCMTMRKHMTWMSVTRWVPGSCSPHPRMTRVDWSTLAWVKFGSQSQWRLGPVLAGLNNCWPISTVYSWVWQTTSWDPTGEAKSANPGCNVIQWMPDLCTYRETEAMPLSASMAMLSEERESLLKTRHGGSNSGMCII